MKKVLKWMGIVLGSLLGLLVLAIIAVSLYAQVKFKPRMADRPLYPISADTSPEGVARGEYLVRNVMACGDCHSPDGGKGTLSGYAESIAEGPIAATIAFPNLTSDAETGLGNWTDAEIARAIREGVDKDGRALIIMPSFNYNIMSDADVAAIIGYLRTQEPVSNPLPEVKANVVAKIMMAFNMMGPNPLQAPITEARSMPAPGTVEYGKYVVTLGSCRDCHGMELTGGAMPFSPPGAPAAPNLTQAGEVATWTEEGFIEAFRIGLTPSGRNLNPEMMPWPVYGTMNDEDLLAIYHYLQSLPPVATANK